MMQTKLTYGPTDTFREVVYPLLIGRVRQNDQLVTVSGRNVARAAQASPNRLSNPPLARICRMFAKYGPIFVKLLQRESHQCQATFLT